MPCSFSSLLTQIFQLLLWISTKLQSQSPEAMNCNCLAYVLKAIRGMNSGTQEQTCRKSFTIKTVGHYVERKDIIRKKINDIIWLAVSVIRRITSDIQLPLSFTHPSFLSLTCECNGSKVESDLSSRWFLALWWLFVHFYRSQRHKNNIITGVWNAEQLDEALWGKCVMI